MKFTLPILEANIYYFMRKCGYAPQGTVLYPAPRSSKTAGGELVFSRIIGPSRTGYPRFHLYIRPGEERAEFNLHLDQKAPIYKGAKAHGGEYEGGAVDQEAERIKLENSKF